MIQYAAKTDVGKVRAVNQDYYITSGDAPQLFILCDGMGGHQSGDVASKTAAESAETYIRLQSALDYNAEKAKRVLNGAVTYANKVVYARAQSDIAYEGMGTTLDICFLDFNMLYIAHVGDSRVYLFRGGKLTQLTRDHSLVEEMVTNGIITEKEAKTHPNKNIIVRAVGTNRQVECDFIATELLQDDMILMCSDGLSNMLQESEIKNELISADDLVTVTENLVACANKNGGNDNITAVVIKKLLKEDA